MSRQAWDNEQFQFVAGVDHVTGAFVQVWNQPYDEQELALLIIDKLGIRTSGTLPPRLNGFVQSLKRQMDEFKRERGEYPNLDEARAALVASFCGFGKDVTHEIYSLWGDEV